MDKQKKKETSKKKNAGYNNAKYEEFITYAEKIAFRNFLYEDKQIKDLSEMFKRIDKVLPTAPANETKYDYIRIYLNTGARKNSTYEAFLSVVKKRKLRSILNDYTKDYSYLNITNQKNYIIGLFVFEGCKNVVIDTLKDMCADLFFSIHEGSSSLILVFDSVEKEEEFKNYIENDEISLHHIDYSNAE